MAGDGVDVHAHYLSPRCLGPTNDGPEGDRITDLSERAEWMGRNGIGVQILAPELRYVMPLRGTGEEDSWARRVNDAVAADIEGRGEFAALALVPLVDGDRAATELERATRDLGLCGGMIHSTPVGGLAADHLNPLWAAAVDLDVPLVLHSSASVGDDRLQRFDLDVRIGRSHDVGAAGAELIFGGAMDRFEALNIVLVTGGGSLPFLCARLDQDYRLNEDNRTTDRTPSEYVSRFYFDSLVFGADQFDLLFDIAGADHIMLGTDWPIPLFEDDPQVFVRDVTKDRLTEDEVDGVLGRTATELFSL